METSIKQAKAVQSNAFLYKPFVFLLLVVSSVNAAFADEGPSINNIKHTVKIAENEMTRQEMLNYVYMAVGFIIVISVAWFSTTLAKKRKIERDEFLKTHHHNHSFKHSPHDPYFKTHGQGNKVRK